MVTEGPRRKNTNPVPTMPRPARGPHAQPRAESDVDRLTRALCDTHAERDNLRALLSVSDANHGAAIERYEQAEAERDALRSALATLVEVYGVRRNCVVACARLRPLRITITAVKGSRVTGVVLAARICPLLPLSAAPLPC